MLRSVLRATVVLACAAGGMTASASAEALLDRSTAEARARAALVGAAKVNGVRVALSDARASCRPDRRLPNTYQCRLSERKKRCKGTTDVYYAGGAVGVRKTRVTCAKKR